MTGTRHLLPLLLACALAAACSGSGSQGTDSVAQAPSATTAAGPTSAATPTCAPGPATAPAPAGSTMDLKVKPVVKAPTTPPPCDLQTLDLVVGKGAEANDGSRVAVKYVGVLYADGSEFDSSWKRSPTETLPFTIGGGVIPGFSNGTKGMHVGGRREIVIPSKEGYGPNGSPPVIPPNADLIFVVDLVTVS